MTKIFWRSFALVFSKPAYIFLALVFFIFFLALILWLSAKSLILFMISTREFGLVLSKDIIVGAWSFFKLNSSRISLFISLFISFLSSINFAMFVYYIKRRLQISREFGLGFFGSLLGIFGVGCASCGSVIIASIFGLTGSVFLTKFPLKGLEIGLLAILAILTSIYFLTKKINNPLACDNRK